MEPALDALEHVKFAAGEDIFAEGEAGAHAYIVQSGEVEITRDSKEGRQRLGVIGEDGIFGEMALIDDRPRMASARALADTEYLVVPKQVVETSLQRADPFLVALLRLSVRNIRSIVDIGRPPPPAGAD